MVELWRGVVRFIQARVFCIWMSSKICIDGSCYLLILLGRYLSLSSGLGFTWFGVYILYFEGGSLQLLTGRFAFLGLEGPFFNLLLF
jgi:hypothetical protein